MTVVEYRPEAVLDVSDVECRQDPELFFPVSATGPGALQTEEAKALCRRCPALEACRKAADALEGGRRADLHGVWAAEAPADRLRRRKREANRKRREAVL